MRIFENVILVTGGAGFIGSAFLRKFVRINHDWFFINLDKLTYAGNLNNVKELDGETNYTFILGDINDKLLVEKIFSNYKINLVINFAAESHVDNSINNPQSFIETNINGVYTLLEVARKFWANLDHSSSPNRRVFLQVSTDEVYGALTKNSYPSNEDDCMLPNSPYSASKAAAELIARSYRVTFDLPIIISRSSNNYGPYQNEEKLIPKLIKCGVSNTNYPIYGDGKNVRDWIHVEDNCLALELILRKGIVGETYNIGGNNELTNLDIVGIISKTLEESSSEINFVEDRLGHDFRYALNTGKINNLGWAPKVSFEEGIKSTIAFYLLFLKTSQVIL
jgi:dTDP-glucose 4,6-dehydratase